MKNKKNSILLGIFILLAGTFAVGNHADEDLTLKETSDFFSYYTPGPGRGPSGNNYGYSTLYGMGGYGDPLYTNTKLSVCNSRVNRDNCTTYDPDEGLDEWRFVKDLGWRKFSRYGAARKDWWDYKRSTGWPVVRDYPNYDFYNYYKYNSHER